MSGGGGAVMPAAVLCKNCPFRKSSPKAGEIGGSVPVSSSADAMRAVVRDCTDGMKVMQCHKSSDRAPRPCAGFLSVVGYDSVGVRLAVMIGAVRESDVGRKIRGLYGSLREMLLKADHLDMPEVRS
jgi:hypothetical protein